VSLLAGLLDAVMGFVKQYGYLAVFVYLCFETANLFPFVPSEVVVPVAASQLVHGPLSFALFVADTTLGATAGSLLAYVLFGRYGERLLERHGHVIRLSQRDLDRSQTIFTKYGESSVFWGRLFPVLRGIVSIPAGVAGMDWRRFTLYSAAGAALFNTALTYLVYTGSSVSSPFTLARTTFVAAVTSSLDFALVHPLLVLLGVGVVVLGGAAVWMSRYAICRALA